jgi:hypothetical protein
LKTKGELSAMGERTNRIGFLLPFLVFAFLPACSVVLEATRPDPVDMSQFSVGEDHTRIAATLGAPAATIKQGQDNCDVYKLYTRGPGAAGKATIAASEAVADVFTLGLAEVVTTPAEAATRNSLHTVTMCFGQDDKLASQSESQ